MNELTTTSPLVPSLGWILAHSLWQGLLLGLAAGVLRRLLRRGSARLRYAAALAMLALLPALPILTVTRQSSEWQSNRPTVDGPHLATRETSVPAAFWVEEPVENAVIGRAVENISRTLPFVTLVWGVGVAIGFCRLLRGCWWEHAFRIHAHPAANADWLETLERLRRRLKISRPVRLLESALVEVPAVIGWVRPAIVLPVAGLIGFTPAQVEAIFAHELAHLRRWDYLVNACQCLLEILLFYHPATWWISNWVREERENCCDDAVIEICADRLSYARALASMEFWRSSLPPFSLAASGPVLLHRISRLLGIRREHPPTRSRRAFALTFFVAGLCLILLGVGLAVSRPVFRAVSRVRLVPDRAMALTFADDKAGRAAYTGFQASQSLTLQSGSVLSRVLDDLNLRLSWSKRSGHELSLSEGLQRLRRKIAVKPIRLTSVFEIQVTSRFPEEAAAIANAVAPAYDATVAEHRKAAFLQVVESMRTSLEAVSAKIDRKRAEVSRLRRSQGLPPQDAPPPLAQLRSTDNLQRLHTRRMELKSQTDAAQALLERLQNLPPDELVRALPTAAPDALLTTLIEQQSLADQRLIQASRDYGPTHTEVLKARALLDDLNTKINHRAEGILIGLRVRMDTEKQLLKGLDAELGPLSRNNISELPEDVSLATHELEALQRFQQVLSLKIDSERIDSQLPSEPVLEVVDRAAVPERPVLVPPVPPILMILFGLVLDGFSLWLLRGRPPLDAVAPTCPI